MRLSGRSRRASLLGALTLISSSAVGGLASADTWPISRHDAGRTGTSTGACPIDKPLVTWRAFMGGKPTARTGRFGGLGSSSLYVAAVGGRFVAKDVITQATLWTSPILGVGYVEAIDDLDGNAASEVVVRTETRVHVLDGKSGAVLWSSPAGKFSTPVAVRVVDLNGDSRPDIYIDECTSCAKPGTMSAGAYSFSGGFAAPTTLWERSATATPAPYNTGSDTIVDLDGNGLPEVVLTSAQEIVVVRGSDGTTIATLSAPDVPGKPFAHARAVAAELDGLPGKELLMVELDGQVSSQQGPAGVTAFKLDPKTGQSSFLYRRVASSYEARMVDLLDVAGDLNGDSIDEVILSYQSPGVGFTTEILGGAAGNVLATLPGARFEGLAGSNLVFASADGLSLYEWKQGDLSLVAGPLPGLRAASVPDLGAWSRGPLDRRLAMLPRPGKTPALVVGTPTTDVPYAELPDVTSFAELEAYALGPAGLTPVGKHKPLIGTITGIMMADHATRPYAQLAVGTSSGAVVVLDQGLKGTNGIVFWGGQATGSLVGGAVQPNQGAQGGPLIAEDAAGPFVVLPGSPLGLYVGDARYASLIVPPLPRFFASDMHSTSVVDLGSLGTAVVGIEEHSVVARASTNGTLLASVDLGPGRPQSTPLPLRVAGQGTPLIGVDWRIDGVQVVQSGVDFISKNAVWQGNPLQFGGFFGSGVGDLDGDGTDEWYSMNDGLNRRDAKTGAVTTVPGENMFYSLPMIAPFSGANDDLLLQAGASAPRLLDGNLSKKWQATSPENVNAMAGARVLCDTEARFVTPAVLSPFVRAYRGATGELLAEKVLAGGAAYATMAGALDAGQRPGVLSNASGVASLGSGGAAVLVGSTDGYLYALDACSLDVRWSKFLGASVAEPVIGDTDGDGADEIMVGTADGYIAHLDIPKCASPKSVVWSGGGDATAPRTVKPGENVEVTFDTVNAATSYEYALVGPDDQALWSPAYKQTTGTSAGVDVAGVLAHRPYRVAVRALNAKGEPSPDVFSPPFVVMDPLAPTVAAKLAVEGDGVTISMSAEDDLALDHYEITMELGTFGQQTIVADGMLDGLEANATAHVVPPADMLGHEITVRAHAFDSGGNFKTSSAFNLKTDEFGNIMDVTEYPPVQEEPEPEAEAKDPRVITIAGCSASGGSTSGPGVLAALGLGLVASRIRRRARRA